MKLALVCQEYFPEKARGGIGTQTAMKGNGLASLGHEVFIISRSSDLHRHERTEGNITEIMLPGMEAHFPEMSDAVQWLTRSVAVAAELEQLSNRFGIDLIDFPEWAAEGFTYLLNRTPWKKIPCVIQLHGPLVMFAHTMNWPEMDSEFYRVGTFMEAETIKLADAVYSSSKCSAGWIQKYYHPDVTEIPIIHTGIDAKIFSPQKVQKNKNLTIIFVGKLVKNKGVEELVDAVCNIVKDYPGLHLQLIGRGNDDYVNALKEKAKKSDAPDFLEFPGPITREHLPTMLCKADIFAAPSYYEGGPGFVYLEAMACGLPVIGCEGSGINEIIHHEENGLLVPVANINKLEKAIRKLILNPEYARQLGNNARKFTETEADYGHCIKKLEEFYKSIIKKYQTV